MPEDLSNPVQDPQSSRDHKRTTVRFTDEEFARISEESKLSGESIPKLLRARYFLGRKLKLLASEGDRRFIFMELRRIGNNVNQIARKVNTGALEGWYPEFADATRRLTDLCQMVSEIYGAR